jgi:hypothetical protein
MSFLQDNHANELISKASMAEYIVFNFIVDCFGFGYLCFVCTGSHEKRCPY